MLNSEHHSKRRRELVTRGIKRAVLIVAVACTVAMTGCASDPASDGSAATSTATQSSSQAQAADRAVSSGAVNVGNVESVVNDDVQAVISGLNQEYEALVAEVGSFESYAGDPSRVESYYARIEEELSALCIRLRQYSVDCANSIMASGETSGRMYDDFDVIYDAVYEDARDGIYDGIYEDLFGNLYDAYYDGILKDAYDSVGYGEWSEVHSSEYDRWSDSHSEVYDIWSDFGSDIYDFWSDLRGDLFSGDIDKAQKEAAKFQEDIDKLLG